MLSPDYSVDNYESQLDSAVWRRFTYHLSFPFPNFIVRKEIIISFLNRLEKASIVVDPELKMNQCGLPKIMALELLKSYVYAGLLEREIAKNLRIAKKMVE